MKIETDREIDIWALDNKGQRRQRFSVQGDEDYKTSVGLEYATILYGIVAKN
jgi:hypothetical protein